MNTRKVLLSMILALMIVSSTSVVSADTHFWKNVKTIKDYSIKDYFKDFRKIDQPTPNSCVKTWFHKCPVVPTPVPTPLPTIVPTPVPTPISTVVPTPEPTIVPTPEPTPIPMKGDISISGSSATPTILTSETLMVIANIRSTFNNIIDTKLEVQVFASEGQPIPFFQSKQLLIGANGAETRIFEFSGLTEGTYQVRISSPALKGETSTDNNAYSFNVKVLPKPTPTPTPTPTPIPFDVSVTGKSNINTNNLEILATVAHNSLDTIEGNVAVTVNGITQTKKIVMKHHDTVISNEDSKFNFDITNWDGGTYPVVISFPVRNNEQNTANNVYRFDVIIPQKPKTETTDFAINPFSLSTTWDLNIYQISWGEYFYGHFRLVNNGKNTGTGTVTIKSEGVTLFSYSYTLTPGQTIEKYVKLDSGRLPHHSWQYDYPVTIEVTNKDDTNHGNDKATAYIRAVSNW